MFETVSRLDASVVRISGMSIERAVMGKYCEMKPLVSVVITTYGDCSTLTRAIDSVLRQTYKKLEIIVVDDNGNGAPWRTRTEGVMKRYLDRDNIIYICHDANMNGSAARNTGIAHASGEFITFLDNDDVMLAARIQNAVNALSDSRFDACFCNVLTIASGRFSQVTKRAAGLTWKDLLFDVSCMGTGSNIFLRNAALREVGYFDVSFRRNQDIEYMLRFLLSHDAVWVNSLDLIKSENGTCNMESIDSYLDTKHHFDETFNDVIARLNKDEKQTRLAFRERELVWVSVWAGDVRACKKSIQRLDDLGCRVGKLKAAVTEARCMRIPPVAVAESAAKDLRHILLWFKFDNTVRNEIEHLVGLKMIPKNR